MLSDLEILKKVLLRGYVVDKKRFYYVLNGVLNRLGLKPVKSKEEDSVLVEYVKRKYKVGGRVLADYIKVLGKEKGLTQKLEKMFGEKKL